MADNEIRNPAKAYFKWRMPVIAKSEDDWNFWNTEDKYNRTMFIGYNDMTTPHVASLFMIVDGKPMQAVGDDVIARIAGLETNTAQALADIQALIDRVNAQQLEISTLQRECQRILEDAESAIRAAQIWAEGTDAQVAERGGEHSAKGWAQKANDIVVSGLPSDASFEHITVTGNSKFGQDPDRENQPGLEIEGTGEIQAYRTVNMHNGATVSYDETVEMPWSDSSNKVPNTAWVQQAVQHGTIDPNTDLTVKSITTTAGFNLLYKDSAKSHAQLQAKKTSNGTELKLYMLDSDHGGTHVYDYTMRAGANNEAYFGNPGKVTWAAATDLNLRAVYDVVVNAGIGRFVTINPKLRIGGTVFVVDASANPATASFGVTPTVPDITDAADSSSKVPNTKWVRDCMTTLTADLQPKLTAGDGIAISESNVISVTGGTGGGAVDSVNGKTGKVVLNATDVGAITGAEADTKITTALEPYAKTADVTVTLEPYAKSADVTADIMAAVAPLATTEALTTGLSGKQDKLTAGSGIAISDTNVISATVSSPVDSVNGNTGAVVLTGDNIMTASDSTTSLNSALAVKQASITADTELTCKSVTTSYDSALNSLNYAGNISFTGDSGNGSVGKITANELFTNALGYYGTRIQASGITCTSGAGGTTWFNLNSSDKTISVDGTITATSPAVDANNNQVATTSWVKTALAGKQDSLTESSDLTVGSLTAGSADSGLYAGRSSIRYTSNGNDKLFVDATGPCVSNLTGGDLGPATGAFNWYINTTTDYNKFNVFNRYHVTDEATHEVTTNDTSVLSIGGSPTDHSTWIDFTATYMSFKGDANFGETGMSHLMNFNGISTFKAGAMFNEIVTLSINEYGEYKNGITWMPRKNATTFGLTAQAPIFIDGWDTDTYTNNLVKFRGCGLQMTDSTGATTFFKLVTNNTVGQLQVNGSMFMTGANNLLHIRQGAGLVVQDANLNVLIDTTTAGQVNMDNNVRLGSTAYDATDDSGNVTEHVDATNVWVNGAALFYTGLTCMPGAPAGFMDDVEFYKTDSDGSATPAVTFVASTGVLDVTAIKATDGSDGSTKLAWDADSRNTDTYGMHINMPVEITATMPAATDSSNKVPTTAWVQSAIAAAGGGSVPDDITCKTLKVTSWGSGLNSIEFAGNLKYSGDYGNGSLGIITAREFYANASGYYSARVSTSGIILTSGASADTWFNADSSTRILTINGTLKSSTPTADANNTEVATTAWVNTAITNKAATKPTLTYAEKAGEPTVTKIEQCNGGSLCTIMWTGNVSTATGHVYINLPAEFASAKIVSTQFTAHDTSTAVPWAADASISGGKIMLSVKSTAASSSASATIVLYKA